MVVLIECGISRVNSNPRVPCRSGILLHVDLTKVRLNVYYLFKANRSMIYSSDKQYHNFKWADYGGQYSHQVPVHVS